MDVFWKICTQANLRVLEWGEPDWPVCQGSVWPLKPLKQNVHRSGFGAEADTHTMHWLRSFGVVWWGGGKGEWQAKCQLDLHSSVYQATSSLPCTGMIAAFGMTVTILKVLNFELKFRECQVSNLSSFYSKSARIILTIGVEGEYLCLSSVLGRGMLPLSAGTITKCNLSTSIIPCRPL